MAALDGRQAKPTASRSAWALWGGVGVLGIAAGVAAWWWSSGDVPAVVPVAGTVVSSVPKVARASVVAPAAEVATPVAPASVPAGDTPPPARAAIEEAVTGEFKPAVAASGASVAVAAPAAVALATDTRTAKAPREKEKTAFKPVALAPASAPGRDSAKVAVAEAQPAAEPAPHSQPPRDADVELLAALMRYSDEVGAAAADKGRAQNSAARMNELTIADLVKRCKALGGDDATQCKKRICSGYWGKAEACPTKQAPKPAKPKKTPTGS